eukprot:1183257-Prorocentrum_minimum.AAC.1
MPPGATPVIHFSGGDTIARNASKHFSHKPFGFWTTTTREVPRDGGGAPPTWLVLSHMSSKRDPP